VVTVDPGLCKGLGEANADGFAKAPIKMLHPLRTATQESNYIGSENIGAIPYQGIILAHSNEAEWQTFKSERNNEALIDRLKQEKFCVEISLVTSHRW